MIGLCIFLVCFLLILLMPCGICAAYGPSGTNAKLLIGPFQIDLLKKKVKKEKNPTVKKKKAQERSAKKGNLTDFLPILKLIFEFLSDFRRKLTIRQLYFRLILAGGDPCDLSVNYGRTWAAVGNIFPHLESLFHIQKHNIEIECDFTADTTIVDTYLDLRLRLGVLLHMVLYHGTRILTRYIKIAKNAKDGVVS